MQLSGYKPAALRQKNVIIGRVVIFLFFALRTRPRSADKTDSQHTSIGVHQSLDGGGDIHRLLDVQEDHPFRRQGCVEFLKWFYW